MYNYSSVEDTVAPGQQGHAVFYTETEFIKGLNYQYTGWPVQHGRVFLVPCTNEKCPCSVHAIVEKLKVVNPSYLTVELPELPAIIFPE